jgi:HPt (histidine-containing phosphotransfer) domain-containing protein
MNNNKESGTQLFCESAIADLVGEEAVVDILQEFLKSLDLTYEQLHIAFSQQHTAHIIMLCHRLKSSSRFVGADEVGNMLEEMEQAHIYSRATSSIAKARLIKAINELREAVSGYLELHR